MIHPPCVDQYLYTLPAGKLLSFPEAKENKSAETHTLTYSAKHATVFTRPRFLTLLTFFLIDE